jgi:hypothetical protein
MGAKLEIENIYESYKDSKSGSSLRHRRESGNVTASQPFSN